MGPLYLYLTLRDNNLRPKVEVCTAVMLTTLLGYKAVSFNKWFLKFQRIVNALEKSGLMTQHIPEDLRLQKVEQVRGNRTMTIFGPKRRRRNHHDLVTLRSKYEIIKSKT
jgi:hypothetical protein